MATILDCKKIQPLLSEYVDGALDEQKNWDVQMHVASCSVCARIAQDFTATTRLLQSAPTPELSFDFEAMLTRRLADESLRPLPLTWWQKTQFAVRDAWKEQRFRPAFATGAALAVMAPVAFLITQKGPVPVTSTPTPVVAVATEEVTSVDELWREHQAYVSSEPLSNPAGLLPLNDARPESNGL